MDLDDIFDVENQEEIIDPEYSNKPVNDYNQLGVWTIFEIGSIRDEIVKYLKVKDLASITATCIKIKSFDEIIFRSYFNITHKSYKQAVSNRHLKENECGFKWLYAGERYRTRCTNSPVYIMSQCTLCNDIKTICSRCRSKAYSSWTYCDFCEQCYSICKECQDIIDQDLYNSEYEDYILLDGGVETSTCRKCHKIGCIGHFETNHYCSDCHKIQYKSRKKKNRKRQSKKARFE